MVNMEREGKCPILNDRCLETSCEWWLTEEEMCAITCFARAFNTQKKIFS